MQIQCALANTGLEDEKLLQYLIEEIPEASFWKMHLPPGTVWNAAFDWKGLLHDAAAVVTLGTVLWQAYTTFVEPLIETGQKPNAGLIFQIKDDNGKTYQVMLGQHHKDKEIFLKQFDEKIKTMTIESKGIKKTIEETERSERWIQIK